MLKLEHKKDEILNLLDSGLNIAKIAENLKEYPQAVRNIIKKYRPNMVFIKNQGITDSYFEEINSHTKAYFLGFIAADGALVKSSVGNTYELTITINQRDKLVLEALKKELKCEHKVKDLKTDNLVRFRISNKNLTRHLIHLGVTPNKSLTLKSFKNKFNTKYFNSFLLGYFDGDGSIFRTRSAKYYISIRGTYDLLNDYNEYLGLNKILKKYDSTWTLSIGSKKDIIKFFTLLYKDSEIFLPRKYEKFQSFLQEKCQDKTISSPST